MHDGADEALVAVLTFGAFKYSDGGWALVKDPERRYFAAMRRHLRGWRRFLVTKRIEDALDKETGFPHLAQALCCLHFLTALWLEDHMPNFDGEVAAREAMSRWQKSGHFGGLASARARRSKKRVAR